MIWSGGTKKQMHGHGARRAAAALIAAAFVAVVAWPALARGPGDPAAGASPAASAAAPASAASSGDAAALTGPQVGAPAPDFSLPTIDGKRVSLADYRGKVLVVNAWATWCPPCRMEMPDLLRSAAVLGKSGVAFLGVDSTEQAPIVRAYVESKHVPYPQAIDADHTFDKAYDIAGFPTTYVIGPDGILRARYVDVISLGQLSAFVAAAEAGKNGEIASPLQTKIDAALNDPIAFTGDAAANAAAARAAAKAIAHAEDLLDESDASKGLATDYLRTKSEEAALRDRAIGALAVAASSAADRALLELLRGDAARDREQWSDALAAYRQAADLDPKSADALTGLEYAAARLKQYDVAIEADRRLIALEPSDPTPLVDAGVDQTSARRFDDAVASFRAAVALAQKAHDAKPHDAHAIRTLAYVHLYFGRTYAKANEPAHARAEFAQVLALAAQLPASNSRHDMYLEEAQEATVALDLATPGATTVSLAPWTGSVLPGSVPDTIKYRLVVAGAGGKSVDLRASGLPKGWVASFCTDSICAPFRVSVDLPASGVKVIEFQLVPPSPGAKARGVRVIESDGAHTAQAFAT